MEHRLPNWVSSYIYHNLNFELVILKLIHPIIKQLQKEQKIQAFFFIRYWEKGPHIRLRVLPTEKHLNNEIEVFIKKQAKAFFKDISQETSEFDIQFNNYIQETDRYGGIDNIKISEQHFQDSSSTVLDIIEQHIENWEYSKSISIAIQMHLIFAKNIIGNTKNALLFFDTMYRNWFPFAVKLDDKGKITMEAVQKLTTFFDTAYKQQKHIIDTITEHIWSDQLTLDDTLSIWSERCANLHENISQLTSIKMPEWFTTDKESQLSEQQQILFTIYDSYIHMTNNRLGIKVRDEAFIAFLIVKGLKNTIEKNASIPV